MALGVLATLTVALAAGLLLRHWLVVPVATVIWPIYYLGLRASWWGSGTGDGWQTAALLLTLSAAAGALGGMTIGGARRRRHSPPLQYTAPLPHRRITPR